MTVSVVAKDASLTSLQVTITALIVSGKQMTLAVFRQLPREHALNDDGSLTPLHWWGRVLYSIKDGGDHWAVGERDGLLYRCYIPDRASRPYHDYELSRQRKAAEFLLPPNERPQARAILESMIAQNDRFEKHILPAFNRSTATLLALPQLFIAV